MNPGIETNDIVMMDVNNMPTVNENKVKLTPKESQILGILYQNSGTTTTREVMEVSGSSKNVALSVLNNLYIKGKILRIPNNNGQRGWNWRVQW